MITVENYTTETAGIDFTTMPSAIQNGNKSFLQMSKFYGKNEKITGYLDQRNTALYPFGHGLSYTSFSYSPTTLSAKKATTADLDNKGEIVVEATVQNTGKRDGEEVVQLYIRQRGASVARPVRELKGFEKKIKIKARDQVIKHVRLEDLDETFDIDFDTVEVPSEVQPPA